MSGIEDLSKIGRKFSKDYKSSRNKPWATWLGCIVLILIVLYFIQSQSSIPVFVFSLKAVGWIFSFLWSIIEWFVNLF